MASEPTDPQLELLAAWYQVNSRLKGRSWEDRRLHLSKPRLDSLQRRGLVGKPHSGYPVSTWCAELTDEGLAVAKAAALEEGT